MVYIQSNFYRFFWKHLVIVQFSLFNFFLLFIGHRQSENLVWLQYPSWRLRNHTRFHWSPSIGKPLMTPVFSVKTMESYDVCRRIIWVTIWVVPLPERTETVGLITASDQTVRAVHSYNSWFTQNYNPKALFVDISTVVRQHRNKFRTRWLTVPISVHQYSMSPLTDCMTLLRCLLFCIFALKICT